MRFLPTVPLRQWIAAGCLGAALSAAALMPAAASTQQGDALRVLKAMADYVANLKAFSVKSSMAIEIITPQVQKIQFNSSGTVLMSRPSKLRATRTGGYTDVELVFDGKTATVLSKDGGQFAQFESPGTIDDLIVRLRDELNVELPGADLLLSKLFEEMTDGVLEAKHIGRGVIDGVECEHLAFRKQDTDWQLWVEIGARPIPRKYVITSKAVAGAPQYTLRITEWNADPQIAADAFAFQPPAGAKKVEVADLPEIDEVPHADITGESK